MIYQWKSLSHITVDPDIAGAVMERLRTSNNGRLTPDMIVAEAQPKASPLHDAFEWNDTRAARLYRKDQASHMIRSIEVVRVVEGQEKPIRAFVSVMRDEDRSYTSVAHALADNELRAQVVDAAWRELEAWRKRHAELIEFARIFAEIDQARAA
jgi:hypothetical protein